MKLSDVKKHEENFRFGRWQFSPSYGITDSPCGKVLLLEPRLSKLLYFLSLNTNTIVSRSYLIAHIWSETIVNEESLTRAVSDLRKLLIKNYNQRIQIETIRGRGYKLVLASDQKIVALKSMLHPNLGYTVLGLICLFLMLLSIGTALGFVETVFMVKN